MAGPVTSAESLDVTAHDLLRDLRDLSDTAYEDPAALEAVEQRLTALGELKRKYGRTLDDVLEFGAMPRAGLRDGAADRQGRERR